MNKHWREVRQFTDLLVWIQKTHQQALDDLAPGHQKLRDLTREFLGQHGLYPVVERQLEALLPKADPTDH